MYFWLCLTGFLAFQIIAALLFKWGSLNSDRYWPGFIFGNIFGMSSILMLIQMHKKMDPATVLGITTGGTFVLCQIALLLAFRQGITVQGWIGIVLVFAGTLVFTFSSSLIK